MTPLKPQFSQESKFEETSVHESTVEEVEDQLLVKKIKEYKKLKTFSGNLANIQVRSPREGKFCFYARFLVKAL